MAPLDPTERLRIAFDLYDFGESMMRQNLRRNNPSASDAEIEAMLTSWLQDRPLLWASASDLAQKRRARRRL
jgi:hypothetical protein